MGELYYSFVLLLLLKLLAVEADHSVHILSENLEQYVTSTTLEWIPSTGKDDSLLSNAVVAAYQSVAEPKQNELGGDEAQEDSTEIVNKPVYVCRAKINSVWAPGQLRPNKSVCIVSLYQKVSKYAAFEILVNVEGSSRLSWVHKSKYTLISQGAVTSGDNTMKTYYIARRPADSHYKENSLTHNVGQYSSSENLGVFYLVDQNNDALQFEDGEILVETEPINYEFRSIKLERHRGRNSRSKRVLGQAILKNEEGGLQRAATVISYKYDYSLYWGKGHGLLTGLPFVVTLPNGTHVKGLWGIPKAEEKSEVVEVEKYLEEGTAVNVTLMGNYTESEIPYNATVVAIYKDNEKREITIRDTKRENKITDVIVLYSPIYFLHNNSHVPTTTTTTSATTSGTTSTTSRATTTVQDVGPIVVPEGITTRKSVDDDNKKVMLSDAENPNPNSSEKKAESPGQKDGAPSTGLFSLVTILAVSFVILRVT